jgi:hypothetical protein
MAAKIRFLNQIVVAKQVWHNWMTMPLSIKCGYQVNTGKSVHIFLNVLPATHFYVAHAHFLHS